MGVPGKLDRRERRWRGIERLDGDRRPSRAVMLALLLACLTLITLDYRGGADAPMEPARRVVGEVLGPVETGMPIHVTDRPLDSVARGSGQCVEEFEALQQVLISEPRH